jgi:hypothetical protein
LRHPSRGTRNDGEENPNERRRRREKKGQQHRNSQGILWNEKKKIESKSFALLF